MTETTMFYIDYPGVESHDHRSISERLVADYDTALDEARRVYRTHTDVPMVVVCTFPHLRRIASVSGNRNDPRVITREPLH